MSSLLHNQPPVITVKNLARIFIQSIIALGVTFMLFAGMQYLIQQDNAEVPTPIAYTTINPIFEEVEEKVITRTRPEPMPEVQSLPETSMPEPTPVKSTGFSSAPKISIPKVGIQNSFSLGPIESGVRPLVRRQPKYPPVAARDGIEGYVVLSFSITASGTVDNIEVIEAQPKGIFETEAKRALRKWKYQPQMQNGVVTAMHNQQVQLDFTMSQ
ncbi:TonB family protein [Glaciecola sp. 1036]|uniref:TonB family protein n=1 Tax=Alteromonadaceae TaxID=72275 RepID=UPI003D015E20